MSAIYLLRHGQASFGSADYDQLSKLGIEQAGVLGAALAPRVASDCVVVCGGMKRHRQTAEHCLAALGRAPEWDTDEGFNEYNHLEILDRVMDRNTVAARLSAASDRVRAFEELFMQSMQRWQGGEHDADYGESWPAYRARCMAALERLAQRLAPDQAALVFSSGGVITTVAHELLRLPLQGFAAVNWRLANAGISKIVCSSRGHFLSSLNEHGHFEGAHTRLLTYR